MIKFLALLWVFSISSISLSENIGIEDPVVLISTNVGEITIRLFKKDAPITVQNFLSYVDTGFYNGTIFHRVIPNFMIQGGGFTPMMIQKETRDPIVNESKNRLHNVRGTIAMARTAKPDSATAQFFINQRTNLRLDWTPGAPGYTVFGEVIQGMDVVDLIAISKSTTIGPFNNVPLEPIKIEKINRR